MMTVELLLLCAALVFTGFLFSACNQALRVVSQVQLEQHLSQRRKSWAATVHKHRPELLLACAFLRMAAHLGLVLLIVHLTVVPRGATVLSYLTALVISAVLIMVFGVAIPLAWARYAAPSLLATTIPVVLAVGWVLRPITAFLLLFDKLVRRLAGVGAAEDLEQQAEEEILTRLEQAHKDGLVDEQQREMIESVMEFHDVEAGQIMTPRTEIVAVDVSDGLKKIRDTIISAGHSRLPVFDGSADNVVGVLYAKDLLRYLDNESDAFDVRKVMRPPHFVPETKRLRDLLTEMNTRKFHIAIVLDEYGGTAGLITIEDIIEEIVGEITDEYEQLQPSPIVRLPDGSVEVDARMRVAELNDELDAQLPESDEYETLAGFVCWHLGEIPPAGYSFRYDPFRITILDADQRRIKRMRLQLLSPAATTSEAEKP